MVIFFVLFILIISGCDTDSDKSVTGAFFDKKPGELKSIMGSPDSITTGSTFRKEIGNSTLTLAGRYKELEASSVFKFSLNDISTDSLVGAMVKFNVETVWKSGTAEFELYETHSDWSDTTRLDPDSFPVELGLSLATVSDTSAVFTTLTFDVDPGIIMEWSDKGSFLIRSSDSGMAMVSLFSDNTHSLPVLKLVNQTADGVNDTTNVNSSEGTYYIHTVIDENKPIISEGYASGFVLNIGIPESVPPLAAINRCTLKMTASESIITEEFMSVGIYKLKNAFTTIGDADTDEGSRISLKVYSDETYEIDITSFVNSWHIGGESNFGLLFKPSENAVSPNQCVFVPGDSLMVTYTALPEVKK